MQAAERTFVVLCAERKASVFEVGADYALSLVKELAFAQKIVGVVQVDDLAVFGLASGIQVFAPSTWSSTFQADFGLSLVNLRANPRAGRDKDQLILALGEPDRSVVLVLEDLAIKAKVEFKSPLLSVLTCADGQANKLAGLPRKGGEGAPTFRQERIQGRAGIGPGVDHLRRDSA